MFLPRPRFVPSHFPIAVLAGLVLSCGEMPTTASGNSSPWDVAPLQPDPSMAGGEDTDATSASSSAEVPGKVGAPPPNGGQDIVEVQPSPTGPPPGSAGSGADSEDAKDDVEVQVTQDCARTEVAAVDKTVVRPADIVFAIDTSGSMAPEAEFVQNVMNDFSQQITDSGIDVRVILIANPSEAAADDGDQMMSGGGDGMIGDGMIGDGMTGDGMTGDQPAPPMNGGPGGGGGGFFGGGGFGFGFGMCIAPPLGSGSCPEDTNLPAYLHVPEEVSSNDALNVIIDSFGQWRDQLRPEATKSLVVVSDDDATEAPNDSAQAFTNNLLALDPNLLGEFTFNGIFGMRECAEIANQGLVYSQLVQETGGVAGELCDQDFQPLFDRLAEQIITTAGAEIACEWEFPTPPEGQTFSVDLVEVRRTSVDSEPVTLTRVNNEGECADAAWYFDDPLSPSKILACPQTCEAMQDDSGGRIDVVFGCEVIDGCAASAAEDISNGDTGACQWPMPEPPDGTVLDLASVNVRYTNAVGVGVLLGNVASAEACADVEGGWYYDNPDDPSAIVACPDTCGLLQGGGGSNVQALFGCDTKPARPVVK